MQGQPPSAVQSSKARRFFPIHETRRKHHLNLSFRRPAFRPEEPAFLLSSTIFNATKSENFTMTKSHPPPPPHTTPHLHRRPIPSPLYPRARPTRRRQKTPHPPPPLQRPRTGRHLGPPPLSLIHDGSRHLPSLDRRALSAPRISDAQTASKKRTFADSQRTSS